MADPSRKQLNVDGTYGEKTSETANKNRPPLRVMQGSSGSNLTQSEQFNQNYSRQGLQPSTGQVSPIRNIKTEKNYDPDKRRGGSTTQSATHSTDQNLGNQTRQVDVKNQTDGVRSVAVEQTQNINQNTSRTRQSLQKTGKRLIKRKKITATKVAGRLAARSITMFNWSWAFWVWLWFQLPFAILSIAFMALTEAIYQLTIELTTISEGDGMLAAALKYGLNGLFNTISKIINALVELVFKFDLKTLDPANFFMLTHILVMLIGWGTLLAIAIIYISSAQKAFSGRGASGKNAMFLLALIGYSIPILNLFPWFFLWTLLVLKNPR